MIMAFYNYRGLEIKKKKKKASHVFICLFFLFFFFPTLIQHWYVLFFWLQVWKYKSWQPKSNRSGFSSWGMCRCFCHAVLCIQNQSVTCLAMFRYKIGYTTSRKCFPCFYLGSSTCVIYRRMHTINFENHVQLQC